MSNQFIPETNFKSPNEWKDNILEDLTINKGKCVDNPSGHALIKNPCRFCESLNPQVNSGIIKSNVYMSESLFPTSNYNNNVMVPPNDRLFRSYILIGDKYCNS